MHAPNTMVHNLEIPHSFMDCNFNVHGTVVRESCIRYKGFESN